MWAQPKVKPLDKSDFFADGLASRPTVPGTVARGYLKTDHAYYTGAQDGRLVAKIPARVLDEFRKDEALVKQHGTPEKAMLKRGEERFNIVCSNCHGKLGDGKGMIAARGFAARRPIPSFHTDRLRQIADGHFYDAIANGYGTMYSMSTRVPEYKDRWAIVAYIRALQLAQHAPVDRLSAEDLQKIEESTTQ
jgi:mono/diheme cytochrome c family protein